ncbi:hypothetical protein TMatcc_001155 [Talaromyces marneffei ATCC 18224]|uniref:Integral membrane protein n=1 Tax=Talaromyces marneffei (strain ATCC 18224 / CBS 334.59 / QM 7333) TaxID=441960 RepID=B6QPD4_TALMQ|nr:uncharacterized protein EYB26_003695 [Talaromyces marneffei]EEA21153.1 conserved hypothetical protein [Talaromyces marneffei ATCC 18224]KAE8550083.1 hypothetical protein EYB25_008614 [Talaromyces marneffei]QGA16028.1 hypothetical protein EYB26_003695 [Talaromyces marneffei]
MSATGPVNRPTELDALVLEAWGQSLMVGALVVMAALTVANMRKSVLLHNLILAELILGMGYGTWIFTTFPVYGWLLSVTSILLFCSWSLHNVIAWMKIRPFLSRPWSAFYINTVILAQPYWIVELYSIFCYFNNIGNTEIFLKIRPWEPLFRDPWWLFTFCSLLYIIKTKYDFGLIELIRFSPRFGVMLFSICASLIFVVLDILSVAGVINLGLASGAEPFWKLSFIFKCLSDIVVLDDFKTALDRIQTYWMRRPSRVGLDSRGSRGCGRPSEANKDIESGIELPTLKKPNVSAEASHSGLDFLSQPQLRVHGAIDDSAGESAGESSLHHLTTSPSRRGSENFYGGLRSSI